jgi:tetratricopeptide (TPR) repeat protein
VEFSNRNFSGASFLLLITYFAENPQGGDKIKESLNIYQDLIDKYGPSAIVLNGIGVALMMLRRFQDAENALLQALEKVCNLFGYDLGWFEVVFDDSTDARRLMRTWP